MTPMDWDVLHANFLPAVLVNAALAALAYASGGVRRSGVAGGLAVGIPIYACLGWRGFSIMAGVFVIGTALTRFGYARKEAMGTAEASRGARGASHALANVGFAAAAAVAAWSLGSPVWVTAFAAALATSSMDTAGSELGPLYGRRTVSMKTFRTVPPGTDGAVSLEGTAAGLAAAAALASLAAAVGLLPASAVWIVVAGAVAGNVYEAAAGARHLLPHGWLNATSTAVGGAGAALLVMAGAG